MAAPRSIKIVGVLGHVGTKNLGDEAIMRAVLENIWRRYPDAEIRGFTINPEDTQERHGIPAFPIRRLDSRAPQPKSLSAEQEEAQEQIRRQAAVGEWIKARLKKIGPFYRALKWFQKGLQTVWACFTELVFLRQCYRNLKGCNLLIIAGSQQLNDYFGGPWTHPYTLLKWSVIARLTRTKVVFLSGGAGPLTSPLSRLFVKFALSLASYHSYRDDSSAMFAEKLGVKGENLFCPDLAYSLRIPKPTARAEPSSRPIVGINPVPFFDGRYWPEHDPVVYESYVGKLASFAAWLLQRGYQVVLFPTQLRADPLVMRDIRGWLRKNGPPGVNGDIGERFARTFEELISDMSQMDFVIATRYHGVVFSYLLNKPVLGIAYHKKTEELMAKMGQGDCALDIQHLDLDGLIARFTAIETRSAAVRKEIEERIRICRQQLDAQYDRVFDFIEQKESLAA